MKINFKNWLIYHVIFKIYIFLSPYIYIHIHIKQKNKSFVLVFNGYPFGWINVIQYPSRSVDRFSFTDRGPYVWGFKIKRGYRCISVGGRSKRVPRCSFQFASNWTLFNIDELNNCLWKTELCVTVNHSSRRLVALCTRSYNNSRPAARMEKNEKWKIYSIRIYLFEMHKYRNFKW